MLSLRSNGRRAITYRREISSPKLEDIKWERELSSLKKYLEWMLKKSKIICGDYIKALKKMSSTTSKELKINIFLKIFFFLMDA